MFLALVHKVESQLRDLYAKKAEEEGYTQSAAADRLGVHRSAITRRLNGRTNMTLETVADMVWAGGGCIDVEIFDPEDVQSSNQPRAIYEPIKIETAKPKTVSVSPGLVSWTPPTEMIDA